MATTSLECSRRQSILANPTKSLTEPNQSQAASAKTSSKHLSTPTSTNQNPPRNNSRHTNRTCFQNSSANLKCPQVPNSGDKPVPTVPSSQTQDSPNLRCR